MSIFVHMIGYRDPELLPSIKDCIANAARPDELRFGIVWQHAADDHDLDEFHNNPHFRILDIPYAEAKGCCWARAQAQALYRGEDYVLQLDSHHRFEPGWDDTLIEMMAATGVEKPVITTYASGYDAADGKHAAVPLAIKPKPFSPDGSLQFIGVTLPNWKEATGPVPARMASGHFFFTLGQHCWDVPYDPNLYFLGEELVMAARSYTNGYDLFHPHRVVVWHQYVRTRPKFWQDMPEEHRRRDAISKARVLKLMGMEDNEHDLGYYGLGTERTLAEFEAFTGYDFKGRRQHEDTVACVPPPTTTDDHKMCSHRSVLLNWSSDLELPDNCRFVAYIVEDEDGKVLWRKDVHKEDDFQAGLKAEFVSAKPPARLIVWPNTEDLKWWNKKYSLALTPQIIYSPA